MTSASAQTDILNGKTAYSISRHNSSANTVPRLTICRDLTAGLRSAMQRLLQHLAGRKTPSPASFSRRTPLPVFVQTLQNPYGTAHGYNLLCQFLLHLPQHTHLRKTLQTALFHSLAHRSIMQKGSSGFR